MLVTNALAYFERGKKVVGHWSREGGPAVLKYNTLITKSMRQLRLQLLEHSYTQKGSVTFYLTTFSLTTICLQTFQLQPRLSSADISNAGILYANI
jgi:hypothetical protein